MSGKGYGSQTPAGTLPVLTVNALPLGHNERRNEQRFPNI